MPSQAVEATLLSWLSEPQGGVDCVAGRGRGREPQAGGGKKVNKLPCRAEFWAGHRGSSQSARGTWRTPREQGRHQMDVTLIVSLIVGPGGAGDVQAQVAQFHAQGLPSDAQQAGGPLLVPADVLQDAGEQEPIQIQVDLLVQVVGVGAKLLADEGLQVEAFRRGRHRRAGLPGASGSSGRKSVAGPGRGPAAAPASARGRRESRA